MVKYIIKTQSISNQGINTCIFNDSKDIIAESEGLMKKVIKMTGISRNVNFIYNPHFETQNEIKLAAKIKKITISEYIFCESVSSFTV